LPWVTRPRPGRRRHVWACAQELLLAALFLFAFALVLAAFVVALALVLAALLAFGLAALLAGLDLAALFGATLDTAFAFVGGAGAVAGALALVVAAFMLMLAALGVGGVSSLFGGFVVAAGAHAKGKSGSDKSG